MFRALLRRASTLAFPRRSHPCADLGAHLDGETVTLTGWVAAPRVLGPLAFAPLRDASGSVQLVWEKDAIGAVSDLGPEYVVAVQGVVRKRPESQVRRDSSTGAVEVVVRETKILNRAEALPFTLQSPPPSEEVRLKYRYLDLRRPANQEMLRLRSQALYAARTFLHARRFLEIETPYLFRATPEGAAEFLVPTRSPQTYFALPQSPQQFKQMLIASGVERYFQVARCFRDEAGRADRQPEFTQLDLEMAFAGEPEVAEAVQGVLAEMWQVLTGRRPATPFDRLPYAEAVRRYGSDKPDVRFGFELEDVTTALQGGCGLAVIDQRLGPCPGASVAALRVPAGVDVAAVRAAVRTPHVLEWRPRSDGSWQGRGAAHLKPQAAEALTRALRPASDETFLLVAGATAEEARLPLGPARAAMARWLVPGGSPHRFLWVHSFPLFERSEAAATGLATVHHPFTAPAAEDESRLASDPLSVHGQHYDVVVDGVELGGGSVRVHDPALQMRIFELLGVREPESTFGHLLRALRSGCPPHAGAALGVDRVIAVALGKASIRDVMAFPKSAAGNDLLTGAPGPAPIERLRELHLLPGDKPVA